MRRGEVLVPKSTGWDREQVMVRAGVIPERRSAGRAEIATGVAAVADMLIDFMFAGDRHCIRRKPRLHREDRPASLLEVIAMAGRSADRVAGAKGRELTAAAGGGAVVSHDSESLESDRIVEARSNRDETSSKNSF